MNERDDLPCDVGYRKPPKASQFKPGESGNPGGRRKGSPNAGTLLNKIAFKKVTITENGQTRQVTKFEVALTQLVNKAAAGDLRALRELLYWRKLLSAEETNDEIQPVSDAKQQLGIKAVLKRMRAHLDGVLEQKLEPDAAPERIQGNAL